MTTMNLLYDDKSEIVFFDVETTVPTRPDQAYGLLEFGAILVCPRKLAELDSYVTLICPADLSRIDSLYDRCSGISRDAVLNAPSFREVADQVYEILHQRVWAGHNILKFDCVRIKEAFDEIGRAAPEPRGTIDSLEILTQKFGRRAGDMRMASLAAYFGLGKQTHRSLDDARMNFEVVKHCATVLFLESSLPDIFPPNRWVSLSASTSSHSNDKGIASITIPSSSRKMENNPTPIDLEENRGEGHTWSSSAVRNREEQVLNQAELSADQHNALDRGSLRSEVRAENLQPDANMDEDFIKGSSEKRPQISSMENCSDGAGFLDPNEVSISSIFPCYWGSRTLRIMHKDSVLQLSCSGLRVRFGISTKFSDRAGRPKLNFVVDASPSLCRVLDACDDAAREVYVASGSDSEWRAVVMKKHAPAVQLHLSTSINGESTMSGTEIYRQGSSDTAQKLTFNASDAGEHELGLLLVRGTAVDAHMSLEIYEYKPNAGIKLVVEEFKSSETTGSARLTCCNERILLLDSSGQDSEEIRTLLWSCSHQVTTVRHVRSAEEMIASLNTEGHFIKLVLLNLHTPMDRNMDILKYLTRRYNIPVIVLLEANQIPSIGKCLQIGAADFLVKPLQMEELSALWKRMIYSKYTISAMSP